MSTWVVHAGALGDSVMLWPLLRGLAQRGGPVSLVARGEHAALAARYLPVRGVDAEQGRFTRMWAGEVGGIEPDVDRVLSFAGASDAWLAAAARMFPNAVVDVIGPPGSASRRACWHRFDADAVAIGSGVPGRSTRPPRAAAVCNIVLYVGAGGRAKLWPTERWREVAERLRAKGHAVEVLMGRDEHDWLSPRELADLAGAGALTTTSLDELADRLERADLVVAADTGPGHLAAQIGVPTLSLSGPTDPSLWAPIGPRVRMLAPEQPSDMAWLAPAEVISAVEAWLAEL